MTWATSRRSLDLPPEWEAIRSQVLQDADYICEIQWKGCLGTATEVDHTHRGNDHSRENLRAACHRCHGKKSSAEGHARKRELRARRKRPVEKHPGFR